MNLPVDFRIKEIVLDLAEVTQHECPHIARQLLDFGVVAGKTRHRYQIKVWMPLVCIVIPM